MRALFRKIIRLVVRVAFGVLLLLLVCLAAVTLWKIPVPLTAVKAPIELALEHLLSRPVSIERSIQLTTSLSPQLAVKGLRIGNPEQFETETFLYLGSAELELELLPLLQQKVYFSRITVDELQVTLEESADGQVNWVAAGMETKPEKKQNEVTGTGARETDNGEPQARERLTEDTLVIKKLRIENMSFFVHEPDHARQGAAKDEARFHVQHGEGTMLPGEPAQLLMNGSLQGHPYTLDLSLASLEEFLEDEFTWTEINLNVAETVFAFRGELSLAESHRELVLQASITGENLSSLDGLLNLDLPPFADYEIAGRLRLADNVFHLADSLIRTGASNLSGNVLVTQKDGRYEVGVNLESPMIQLDDFIFKDWSWSRIPTDAESQKEIKSSQVDEEKTPTAFKRLTDPEILKNIDAFCVIQAQAVFSGQDKLGRGIVNLTIHDGRLAIEPVLLHLPGGRISLQASVEPGVAGAQASLSAKISNFDIGVLARRKDPETQMGGLVNLDAELTGTAGTLAMLLERGSGHFDFSGQLENIKAGAVDLWAVNLLTAMLTSTKNNTSQINCAVGRWTVRDGLLTPDVLFVDTGQIRICGSGEVDLANNVLNLTVRPTPKKAEYFNVATPVKIKGSFDDVKVGVVRGGILGSAVRFVTSPVFTPLKRVVTEEIPADGADACNMVLGAGSRENIRVRGCN